MKEPFNSVRTMYDPYMGGITVELHLASGYQLETKHAKLIMTNHVWGSGGVVELVDSSTIHVRAMTAEQIGSTLKELYDNGEGTLAVAIDAQQKFDAMMEIRTDEVQSALQGWMIESNIATV